MEKPVATITGVSGFIGSHLCRFLKDEGYYVLGADKKRFPVKGCEPDEYFSLDLSLPSSYEEFYGEGSGLLFCLAADMGGMGFIGRKENDFTILTTNTLLNVLAARAVRQNPRYDRVFFSSSACIYPNYRQDRLGGRPLTEMDAYPANPDSPYGWEKLYAEHVFLAAATVDLPVRIARYHNIYGPGGEWDGGREKAPAAACRKAAFAKMCREPTLPIWGDGQQIRSFCYIEDCLEATVALMHSNITEPVNIGSDYAVTIEELHNMATRLAGWPVEYTFDLDQPQGVRYRNADLTLIRERLGWEPEWSLLDGMGVTYNWVEGKVQARGVGLDGLHG